MRGKPPVQQILNIDTQLPQTNCVDAPVPECIQSQIRTGLYMGVTDDGEIKVHIFGAGPQVTDLLAMLIMVEDEINKLCGRPASDNLRDELSILNQNMQQLIQALAKARE